MENTIAEDYCVLFGRDSKKGENAPPKQNLVCLFTCHTHLLTKPPESHNFLNNLNVYNTYMMLSEM